MLWGGAYRVPRRRLYRTGARRQDKAKSNIEMYQLFCCRFGPVERSSRVTRRPMSLLQGRHAERPRIGVGLTNRGSPDVKKVLAFSMPLRTGRRRSRV
jgi:hypothetical protein